MLGSKSNIIVIIRITISQLCKFYAWRGWVVMVFYAIFNNISVISWQSVLLVEETRVPEENHRSVASHWQTLSHNVVSSTPAWAGFKLTTLVVIGTDLHTIGIYKSSYHTITTTTANFKHRRSIEFKPI